jgi:hypothetical protein
VPRCWTRCEFTYDHCAIVICQNTVDLQCTFAQTPSCAKPESI